MIYILDNDPKKTAEFLDDKSLEKMIKGIAQVLCNVHWFKLDELVCGRCNETQCKWIEKYEIPLNPKNFTSDWTEWARECKANYLYLVELGHALVYELEVVRNQESKRIGKLADVLYWARDNVPDLPGKLCGWECNVQPLPVVIPKKYNTYCVPYVGGENCYHTHDEYHELPNEAYLCIIKSYRNYYQAKLTRTRDQINAGGMSNIPQDLSIDFYYSWTNRSKPEWVEL